MKSSSMKATFEKKENTQNFVVIWLFHWWFATTIIFIFAVRVILKSEERKRKQSAAIGSVRDLQEPSPLEGNLHSVTLQ